MSENCPYCSIGHLHPARRTLVRVYGDTLIHIPQVPAQQCDVCGNVFYNDALLRRYDVLIGESGLPPNRHTPAADERVAASGPGDAADSLHEQPK